MKSKIPLSTILALLLINQMLNISRQGMDVYNSVPALLLVVALGLVIGGSRYGRN